MRKLKLFLSLLMLMCFSVGNVWGTDVTYEWSMPFSSATANADIDDDDESGATMGVYTSKGALNAGSWTNVTNGSYFNVATNGYFLLKLPLSSSTTSFSLQANVFAWKSNKYAAKTVSVVYYTSKKSTTADICSGSTTTSGCYEIDESVTLGNGYAEDDGVLYIKITPAAGNVGFESLSVTTTTSGGGSSNPTLSVKQNNTDITSLAFGNVANNADYNSLAKTFSLTGSNLTEGTITLTAPNGFSVSPTSINVSAGNLSAQTITVKPNTTTNGTYNGNLTIYGGGIAQASAKTVALSMTVVDPPHNYTYTHVFTSISGFNNWGNSYSERIVKYASYGTQNTDSVNFASANKQSSTITDRPVTKGGDVSLVMLDDAKYISAVKFVCKQWNTNSQTITLNYSTNGGESYSTLNPSITSTNFTLECLDLPAKTNAVKFTFSNTGNNSQVGISSVSFDLVDKVTYTAAQSTTGCTLSVKDAKNADVANNAQLEEGDVLTVSASASTGYENATIAVKKTSDNSDVTTSVLSGSTLTMPAYGITIVATATKKQYTVTLSATNGKIQVGGEDKTSITVEHGDEVTLTAVPNTDYGFQNWTSSDYIIETPTTNPLSITIEKAGTITANFISTALTDPALSWNAASVEAVKGQAAPTWPSLTNSHNVDVTYSSTNTDVATISNTGEVSIVGVGSTTIKATHAEDATYSASEASYTLTVKGRVTWHVIKEGVDATSYADYVAGATPVKPTPTSCDESISLVGWTTATYAKSDDAPTTLYTGNVPAVTDNADYYAVWANVEETGWNEITSVANLTAGTYAICSASNFMKAEKVSNKDRFQNGTTAPSITAGKLDEAPASDCQWTLSINTDGKYLFQNGSKYAGAKDAASSADLLTDATSDFAQWTITRPATVFVVENVGRSTSETDPTKAYLRNNGEYGWASYADNTGSEPRFFKYSAGSATNYTTNCEAPLPPLDAPTFPVAEGVYYENTNITISAADGVSIYYTLDETTPSSTNGTLYNGAITLDTYGTYHFKAIAIKEGRDDSQVAEATYNFGMTFDKVSDLFTYLNAANPAITTLNNVKVTGVVSRITTAWDGDKGYLTYYISDNGQTTNELQMFKGAGLEANVLAVGDQVTVTGNYTFFQSTTHEFGQGNTIVARTAATVASVAIGGTAEKTNYSPQDNVFDRTGLTATATYNTGYTKDVTADATWTNNLTNDIVAASGNVGVTATFEGQSDTKQVAVTYTTKTLDHITLSYTSKNAYIGQALPTPTVTASYVENIADEDVTAQVAAANGFDTESAYNKNAAGSYTINVSYTLGGVTKSAEYTVTVKAIYNEDSDPYTVTEALDIIINAIGTTNSTDSIVVAGTVSEEKINNYNNTYKISDGENELLVYAGKGFNGNYFTNTNYPKEGDVVKVKGKVVNYQGNTPEFVTGQSKLLSQVRPATIAIEDVTGFEVGDDDMTVTVTTASKGDITFESGDETVVSIVGGKLHAVAAGTATITANLAATTNATLNYTSASTTFNVTVTSTTKYTITFDSNGADGGSAPAAIANKAEGADVTLPANTWEKTGYTFERWKVINNTTNEEVSYTGNSFTMPASNVTIKAQWVSATDSKWVLVEYLSQLANGDKVIIAAAGYDYALGAEAGGSTKYRSAVGVSKNGKLLLTTGSANQLTLGRSGNEFTFKVGDNFLNWTSGNSMTTVTESDETSTWLISFDEDGKMHIINKAGAASNREIQYNANSGQERFATYTGSQQAVVIYKYLDIDPEDATSGFERVDLELSGIGTICLPYNVKASDRFGGVFYMPSHKTAGFANFIEETGTLVAGKAYIFVAENEFIRLKYSGDAVSEPLSDNNDTRGLIGTFTGVGSHYPASGVDLAGKYVVANGKLYECNSNAWLDPYRAYLDLDVMPENPVQVNDPVNAAPRRILGIAGGRNNATGCENINATDAPVKMIIDGQLFILRGEKMYNANGQLVK